MSDSDPYAEYSEEEPVSEENEEQEEISDSDSASVSDHAASGTPQIQYIDKSLKEAIHTAPLAQLRLLLTNICSEIELAAQLASSHLLVPVQGRPSQKRKAFEKCKNCGMDYNIVTDADKRCIYHSGRTTVDYESDAWIDHDDQVYGDPEHLYDHPDYVEGFKWTCCDKHGYEEGCVTTVHNPQSDADVRSAKRARY